MALRRVCCLTSWFRIPEQGMKRFEVLSQASAVAIGTSLSVDAPQQSLLFLTSAHVVQPWAWRAYYPQEWIDFVKPTHAKYTIDIRETQSGKMIASYELDKESIIVHPSRDVAALSLTEESKVKFRVAQEAPVLPVHLSDERLTPKHRLEVAGYSLSEEELHEDEDEDDFFGKSSEDYVRTGHRGQIPEALSKVRFLHRTENQSFLRTPKVLMQGMCGGPVLDQQNSQLCYCTIEGIVSESSKSKLAGGAAYIESTILREWLYPQTTNSISN